MNNQLQYQYKSYLDIIPNDILHYMLINEYLSPKLNIMWKYISSLNKAILKIPNNSIKDNCYSDEEILMNYSAEKGYIKILQWAINKNMKLTVNVCCYAAREGHLEVLKWLRSNRCPWNENVCCSAAEGGHIEILKWARENGCPWNEVVCSRAAWEGHIEIIKWARFNGCPMG